MELGESASLDFVKYKDQIFYPGRERSFNIDVPKSVRMPAKICCLHVRSDWDRVQMHCHTASIYQTRKGFVKEVNAQFWNYKNGKATSIENFCCFKTSRFWQELYNRARKGGTLHIFCWDAWPYWCLLDGKKEVDEGRILLDLMPSDTILDSGIKKINRGTGLFVVQNPPTIISLAIPGGGRVKILDLRNYGIEPQHMPTFLKQTRIDDVKTAVIGYRSMLERFDMGTWQPTSASQAWYTFRRSHMVHKIEVNPIKRVLDLEQACYYGGRCEVKKIGKLNGLIYHIDVNSMYTALAGCMPFPSRHIATVKGCSQSEALNHLIGKIGAADITVETNKPIFPCGARCLKTPHAAPVRKTREHILYPTGVFRTGLCGPELLAALQNHECKIHRLQVYSSEMLLQSWSRFAIDARAKIRASSLSYMEPCFKKIINCLPGKFGQRKKQWIPCREKKTIKELKEEKNLWIQEWGFHPDTDELTQYRTIGNNTEYLDEELLADISCPIISAVWTSYGRCFLWTAMECVGHHNIVYYDTDSFLLLEDGFNRAMAAGIIDQQKPLFWKVKEQSSDVEIAGIRRYRFGDRVCVAGPFGSEVFGDKKIVKWNEHDSFENQMQHNRACEPIERTMQATTSCLYRHGIVNKDGSVTPFTV